MILGKFHFPDTSPTTFTFNIKDEDEEEEIKNKTKQLAPAS